MLGAIAGDVIGSAYEVNAAKTTYFRLFPSEACFPDDTALTVATAKVLLGGGDYGRAYRRFGRAVPHAGYGGSSYCCLGRDGRALSSVSGME